MRRRVTRVHSHRGRGLAAGLVVSLAGVGVVSAGLAQPAGAADPLSFNARSQAVAVDASFTNASLPIGLIVQGIGPEASSFVSSNGQSDAEASFPYIGPVLPGVPGIFGPLFGLPALAYPAQVVTGAGDPPRTYSAPGVSLSAESSSRSNVGRATAGTEATGSTSTSRVDVNDEGDVIATAETSVDALNLLNLVTIKGIRSRVTTTADSDTGKLTRTSTFAAGEIVVPGLAVTLPETTPGQVGIPVPLPGFPQLPLIDLPPIPLPFGGETLIAPKLAFQDGTFSIELPGNGGTQFAIPAQTVLDAFKAAGITISYQAPKANAVGVEGATLSVAFAVPSLPEQFNALLSGPSPVTFAIGRANAFVTVAPVAAPPGGTTGGATGSTSGATAGGAGATSGAAAGGTVGGTVGGDSGDGFTDAPPLDSGSDGSSGVATGAPPVIAPGDGTDGGTGDIASPQLTRTGLLAPLFDASNIYLAFVLTALGALVSMTLLRLLGVRTLWS